MLIAEVSQRCDISCDTLRYYERIGLIPKIRRGKSGARDYSESDCEWIEFIKCMRNSGLPVKTLILYVRLSLEGEATAGQRKALLVEQRKQLAEKIESLAATLKKLDYKIRNYDKIVRSSCKAAK